MKELDIWYNSQPTPLREFYLAMRMFMLKSNPHITESYKYKLPFFLYKGKMCCYLWFHKKLQLPYLGIVAAQHIHFPALLQEKRKQMKILLLNPTKDMPINELNTLLTLIINHYEKK